MKRAISIAIIVSLLLMGAMLLSPHAQASPSLYRPYQIIESTIEGGGPATVDPAACYDTASGELLMNVYDTLIFFNGEQMGQYLPQIAESWVTQNTTQAGLPTVSPEGLPWYYRYTFKIRTNVTYQTAIYGTGYGNVTPADVEYDIERGMIMDFAGGPQWMFYEPLLAGANSVYVNGTLYDPASNMADRAFIGKAIDHSVESNATHVWFNLVFPGAYAPFLQILSQTWASIYPKQWCLDLNAGVYGPRNPANPNWNGTFDGTGAPGNYLGWWAFNNPPVPPLDDPDFVTLGAGPFYLTSLDNVLSQWTANKSDVYWRGWPANWPKMANAQPKGYVKQIVISWADIWSVRSTKFLAGDVDYCAVPRQYISSMLGQPGIRCTYPLPSMAVDALFFNYDIDPATPFGPILGYNTFAETAIPRNFFGNDTWGIYVRKAFASAIDYATFISTVYLGEAMQPPTAIIPGLPQYNGSIAKYQYNLVWAAGNLSKVPGLNTTGFTISIAYNTGNLARQTVSNMLKAAIESLNPKYHVNVVNAIWATYLAARNNGQLTAFTLGWLADYPDAHNFAFAFYYTYGNFPYYAAYSDPTMDALIDAGIRTPDGPARDAIYSQIQQRVIDTCPSVALDQGIGRHFERNFVVGWYYNPIYSGNYEYNTWKWFYWPQSNLTDVTNVLPKSNELCYDVNYDGTVNMIDVGTVAASAFSSFGPPMSSRWIFRADLNNDRTINMQDVGRVASAFLKTSTTWVAPSPP